MRECVRALPLPTSNQLNKLTKLNAKNIPLHGRRAISLTYRLHSHFLGSESQRRAR